MGIDIYLRWPKQTKDEEKSQITGFSITSGNVGYLREAYHGGPYVTQFLVREAFESKNAEADIQAKVMRDRLPVAVMLAIYREHVVYGEGERSVIDVEDKDKLVNTLMNSLTDALEIKNQNLDEFRFNDEQVRAVKELIASRRLDKYALTFVDFVELAERKENETGKPCTVIASY